MNLVMTAMGRLSGRVTKKKAVRALSVSSVLGVGHPVLEAEQVIHQGVSFAVFFVKESTSRSDFASFLLLSIFSTQRE